MSEHDGRSKKTKSQCLCKESAERECSVLTPSPTHEEYSIQTVRSLPITNAEHCKKQLDTLERNDSQRVCEAGGTCVRKSTFGAIVHNGKRARIGKQRNNSKGSLEDSPFVSIRICGHLDLVGANETKQNGRKGIGGGYSDERVEDGGKKKWRQILGYRII